MTTPTKLERLTKIEEEAAALRKELEEETEANKPQWVPVKFESKKELAQALLDGRDIRRKNGNVASFNPCYGEPWRVGPDPLRGMWRNFGDVGWEEKVQPKKPWYESIPEGGIRCYVSDCRPYPKYTPSTIIGYYEGDPYPFKSEDDSWKYAVPVDKLIKLKE